MAFINDDNDIWGDAGSKTSEGKFNSTGGGYGRHNSTRGIYGRHASSSRGQGDDLLADAQDFLLEEDLPRGGGRHSNAIEDMRQRERERARQRASKRLGGPGVNRSGKPTLQNSSSPVRQQKARDFSRPRQNLRFSAMSNSSNVSFGMDDGNEVSHFDPFEDDDLEEEELPSKSSLRRGNRREVVSESIDRGARHGYVDEDYDDQERWKAGSEKVNEKARKRAARERNLFDDDVEELDQDEGRRSSSHRSARSNNNKGRDEGKTSNDAKKKNKKIVRMDDSDDDDEHVVATIHRKSPSKKNRSSRFKDSKRKGFVEEDEDATKGVIEGKTQNRKNRKKGRVPRPPREVDSDDDGDEDDMFKIDPHALDRRNLTKEVSKQPPPTR